LITQKNLKILFIALFFGGLAWLAEASIDFWLKPHSAEFDLFSLNLSQRDFFKRLGLLFWVTALVALTLKTSSRHRQTKEALWQGERLVESIFESVQDSLVIKDRDLTIMRFNPTAARWYDFAMPLLGRKCHEVLKDCAGPCSDCPTAEALKSGKPAQGIMPKPGAGGRPAGWLEIFAYPLTDHATGEICGVIEFARDITQRKEAEAALREREEQYRLLVNNIPAVVFKGYLDWSIEFIDNKIEELTGYHQDEFNSRRLKWRQLILPEDFEGARRAFIQALKTNKPYVREYRIRHKDGHPIWIQARGHILCDLQGKVEYIYGVFFDITEQQQAEEALRQSRARLDEAQQLARLGNWEWRIPSNEVLWSDEVYRILSLDPGEAAPSFETYLKTVPPEDRSLIKRAFSDALHRQKPYKIEHRVSRSDGWESIVYAQGEIFYDAAGQPLRMMGTIQDITERKRAERALAESERRYRLLAEHVTDVIWTMDLQLNFTYVSPSIQWLTGYEAQDYLQLPLDRVLTPATLEMVRSRLQEELAKPEDPLDPARAATLELELYRRDGSTVWAEVKASLLRDGQGQTVGILGVSRDITVRRKLEAQLQQAQKMEVVGRLAGGVAHDFNNLLTAILGYSGLLLAGLDEGAPNYQELMEVKKAGERAGLLTRQLLAFSRRQVLQPKPLNLNKVLENLAKMLKRVIGEDIQLNITYGAGLGLVLADPGQMEQVILNLTVNARDAMPRGGQLSIETANVELDDAYARSHAQVQPGKYVMLAVTDSGFGMDAATRDHIFEPFFTTKDVGKGTGLGLSTVYGIVHQSGGHIYVYSDPGLGATFKVYLPRATSQGQADLAPKDAEEAFRGQETILLVEDEDVVREIAGRILRRSGYQVLEARDGHDALQICREYQGPIHAVLTDLVMPGMSGRQLVLRLNSLRPGLKVALMSGYAEEDMADQEGLGRGLVFIQKPFEAGVLTRKIWELLHSA
jgi:PAS domain S-box-containing protein